MVRHQPLQYYEPQLCLSCLTGIYGCRWKRYQRSHDDTTKWECLWFLILSLTFFLTLSWFYFWWEVHNDYDEFNWFVYNRTGYWSDWSIPVLVTTAAGFTYIAFLLVLALCHITVGQQMNLHWLHKIGVTATLVATVVAIISIDQLWKEEWNILFISFQATAPFLHVGGVVAITLLAWLVAGQFARAERASFQVVLCIAYLSVVLALYLVPLTISSPCIMLKKDLGSRPAIFGHRGAPMMAPENTLMSFQKAIENKADGVQTDVSLSHDGVPFLMHDNLLRRTTNVDEKFSERASVHSSMFNWTDLEQLNAGEWFTTNDPFWTVHSLSASDSAKAANQSVCRLDDLLSLAKASNISVILNLQDLPVEHPYNNNFINITLETIMNSGILQHMVVWLHDKDRQLVRQISPDFQQASESKREVSALIADGIFSLYLRYSQINVKEVREYTSRNLSTILYTVNEPWLYSVLWCAGVKSVTSDASHILKQVPSPIWLMVCSSKQSELQKRIFY
ncbi:glycerophosphodiester phosphodiesterase domain-containing protein 5 isoform X1 [Protopterus annectens]|uniref:glycerophosphodiester phosphodiesterase domain-containing protein 5 isoform X1 n=1 Tax=Protopterus annectens TaxID=7888 RepID=UPI001CFC220C|nr:glycerophosphodiester phosphodiesterase domain-containing protein 5 isoform X1 [Protopterus annectens]